jgi:hypothetical protein
LLLALPPAVVAAEEPIKVTVAPDRLSKGQTAKVTIRVNVPTTPPTPPGQQKAPGDKDPDFDVRVPSGKISRSENAPSNVVFLSERDSFINFSVKRNKDGGRRADATVILKYTPSDDFQPGEVLITVVGSQGIRTLGVVDGGGPLFEGLGQVNLLPVDGLPTKGPVLQPPFDPTPGAVNPTDEMVQRAAGIAALLAALAFLTHFISRENRLKLSEGTSPPKAEPPSPVKPPTPDPIPTTADIRPEGTQKKKRGPSCRFSLSPEKRDYLGNGDPDDGIRLVIKALPPPGWQARIIPESMHITTSYPTENKPVPVDDSPVTDQVTFQVPLPWLWSDAQVTVTLQQATVEMTPGPEVAAAGGEIAPCQYRPRLSQNIPVLGANPKVVVEPVPLVVDATGWDRAQLQVTKFWLFYQPVSLSQETLKVNRAKGAIGVPKPQPFEQDGDSWTPPFLVQEQGYVEPVRLEVNCNWVGGPLWQKALEAREKNPGQSGTPPWLDDKPGCEPTTHRSCFTDSASFSFCRPAATARRSVPWRWGRHC